MGQGTTGLEFEAQAPDLDTVLVSVGGGGFIGGIAAWYEGKVEGGRRRTRNLSRAARGARGRREPVDVDVDGIAADSLGARSVGRIMFPIAQDHVELRGACGKDDDIRAAQDGALDQAATGGGTWRRRGTGRSHVSGAYDAGAR